MSISNNDNDCSDEFLHHDDISQDMDISSEPPQIYQHLVLSGGGIRGIAFLGAIAYLEENNLVKDIKTFVGSSIGAVLCCLLCLGYRTPQLYNFLNEINFQELPQINVMKIITHFGLDSGNTLVYLIKKLFIQKGIDENISFFNLYNITRKKLILTGTCVNEHEIKYFDYENTPNMKVVDAIRISMSVPFLYTSPKYKDEHYVDGGILDNFPIHLFRDSDDNVLAIKLVKNIEKQCLSEDFGGGNSGISVKKNKIEDFEDFCVHLVYTLLDEIEFLRNRDCKHHQENSTIYIDTKDYSSFRFDLNQTEKQMLYNMGYKATTDFFKQKIDKRNDSLQQPNLENIDIDIDNNE